MVIYILSFIHVLFTIAAAASPFYSSTKPKAATLSGTSTVATIADAVVVAGCGGGFSDTLPDGLVVF